MDRLRYSPVKNNHRIGYYNNRIFSPCFSITVSIFLTIVFAKIINFYSLK